MLSRRQMLATLATLSGSTFALPAFAKPADLKTAARDAWLYGLPLIEMAHTRSKMVAAGLKGDVGSVNAALVNAFVHSRVFAGPQSRAVTTPNVDTLYSTAFLDLTAGPVTIALPPTGERYCSLALMDMFTNNFVVLGTRTTGGDGGNFTIIAPEAEPVRGAIRSPTPWVWALIRLMAVNEADFPAAHALQDQVVLKANAGHAPKIYAERDAPWSAYFEAVQALLSENPPPVTDMALFERVAALGLGAAGGFNASRFSAAQIADIEAGIAAARAFVLQHGKPRGIAGWTYPSADLGFFGQDYTMRALVALGGLGALPNAEAVYMRAIAPDGTFVFGDGTYRLHFAAGQLPPVNSFWSFTMYEATPDGQFFLTPNALQRYAIGDRTPGLQYGTDGSLDIWIGRSDPGGARHANWLPAPARGPFTMTLRGYLPKPAFFNGEYRLPPIAAG